MESLYLLVPVALVFLVIAIRVLFWAVNSGQYDDLDTEGHRILFDEPTGQAGKKQTAKKKTTEGKETQEAGASKDHPAE